MANAGRAYADDGGNKVSIAAPAWCSAVEGGVRLTVQVTPNARQSAVVGVVDGALKLKLQARAVDGQANAALLKWLAEALGVARGAVLITHGGSSRRKRIEVRGATVEMALRLAGP